MGSTQSTWALGRKKRGAAVTDKAAIFKRFLTFKNKLEEMDQEKLDEIIRGVVQKVMQKDTVGVDSELMTRHISKILLRQKDVCSENLDVPDSSVSANDL